MKEFKKNIPSDLCNEILDFDDGIRFAGIVDKFGKILKSKYRKGTIPLLSKQETRQSIVQSTIKMGSSKLMQPLLGRIIYSSTRYEKVRLATLPLKDHSFLMLSFETTADLEETINSKVIPYLQKLGMC